MCTSVHRFKEAIAYKASLRSTYPQKAGCFQRALMGYLSSALSSTSSYVRADDVFVFVFATSHCLVIRD